MVKIDLKPLSVNECWKGRRFKTNKYIRYQTDMLFLLPNNLVVPDGPLSIYYEFGFSSKASDIDNPVKPFQDILQKRYKFDDKLIEEMHVRKVKVTKGKEYVKFEIKTYKK